MMPNVESVIQLYQKCKNMDIEETLELVLSAETEEEKEFFLWSAKTASSCYQPGKVLRNMKIYIPYAGINGAGKTTLYGTTHCHASMFRVNADEIMREFGD